MITTILIILSIIILLCPIIYYKTKKNILISYAPEKFTALGSTSSVWILKYDIYTWFGIYKNNELKYRVPYHHSLDAYTENWDKMIKNKTPFK